MTVASEEYEGQLYVVGSKVEYTEQGDMYEGELHYPGTEYPDGLYSGFTLAEVTTREVTALTV